MKIEKDWNVPRLRFEEFNGKWELRKLGDSSEIIMGQSPPGDSYNTNGDGEPLVNGPVEFTSRYPVKIKWTTMPTRFCKSGDILFCVRGSTTGRMNIANDKYCIGRGVAAIRAKSNSNTTFIELLLIKNLSKILSLSAGSTFVNLDSKSLRGFKFHFPSLPEQKKIATFLTAVDTKIQQLTEKKALLEQYKKGVMQQLFRQEIRFRKENGEEYPNWENRKFSEILFEHKENSRGTEEVFSVSVHKGLINQIEHLGRSFAAANTSHYNLVKPSDIVYTKSPTGDFPYGIIKQSRVNKNVIVSPLYGVFTPETEALGYILNDYFCSKENVHNYLHSIIQKGAKNTINITNKTFLSKSLKLPVSKEEQQKIANFLTSTDEKIEQVGRQLEGIRDFKKGLLQQMFV